MPQCAREDDTSDRPDMSNARGYADACRSVSAPVDVIAAGKQIAFLVEVGATSARYEHSLGGLDRCDHATAHVVYLRLSRTSASIRVDECPPRTHWTNTVFGGLDYSTWTPTNHASFRRQSSNYASRITPGLGKRLHYRDCSFADGLQIAPSDKATVFPVPVDFVVGPSLVDQPKV